MLRLDEFEQREREAAQHARLVEGMSMASRGKVEFLRRYIDAWQAADWLHPKALPVGEPKKVDPSQALANDPYFRRMVRLALDNQPVQGTVSTPPPVPAPVPPVEGIYRVERPKRVS